LDLVSTGRLNTFHRHAVPRYGSACHRARRRDANDGVDQVSCGVIVRQARRIEIGRIIEVDLGCVMPPEGRKWWALRHRFSCSLEWRAELPCRQRLGARTSPPGGLMQARLLGIWAGRRRGLNLPDHFYGDAKSLF